MQVFRDKMLSRGTRTIVGLGRSFKIFDDNGDRTLDKHECAKAIHDLRCGLDKDECVRLVATFDRNGDGVIDYEEFLYGIRGEMNQFRKDLCMRAFKIMDKDGSGILDLSDIKGVYNAKKHPDVIQGKKTEDEVLVEFLHTFEIHHGNHNDDPRDGSVTPNEWI